MKMEPQEFKSKEEVIAFVTTLGTEEAILLGNLWLEIKDKVTALEQTEIIARKELEKQKAVLEKERERERDNKERDKTIIELKSYIRAKDEELAKTRAANENFIINKFEGTFGRFIEKTKTSAGIGLMGEEFVAQILSKIGPGIHYENVTGRGHQGDFKIMFPRLQTTILLEVKNFSETQTSLPKRDIDKFFSDLADSTYHAGILLSLNSQCKMDVEDLSIQDDPKSGKKYMFLSKFVSSVKGDHDFALQLALNVLANAVQSSRANQDDISKEMLTFIKSQLEFITVQFKDAKLAEQNARKMTNSLKENMNKIRRQISDWEKPHPSKRTNAELQDDLNVSPPKRNAPYTPSQNQPYSICKYLQKY